MQPRRQATYYALDPGETRCRRGSTPIGRAGWRRGSEKRGLALLKPLNWIGLCHVCADRLPPISQKNRYLAARSDCSNSVTSSHLVSTLSSSCFNLSCRSSSSRRRDLLGTS